MPQAGSQDQPPTSPCGAGDGQQTAVNQLWHDIWNLKSCAKLTLSSVHDHVSRCQMELKHIMNIPYPSQSQWSSTVPRKIDKISEQNCAQAVPHACTLTSWSLGSPTAQLLGKQFVQTKSDKYIKASHYCPIVKESTSERWDGFHL